MSLSPKQRDQYIARADELAKAIGDSAVTADDVCCVLDLITALVKDLCNEDWSPAKERQSSQ